MANQRVWLITGCSSGFGWELCREALSRGDRVIATSRNANKLADLKNLGASTVELDVCQSDEVVNRIVAQAVEEHGRIDILVNNAGYLLEGTVEACSDEEIQAQFNCNVFGLLRMIRAVLPYMRAQKSGTIANLGSIGGWRGTPTLGMYCATKFAVAGITDTLRVEVEPFGIDVTIIEPGYFRTNFLTSANRTAAKRDIPDYAIAEQMKGTLDQVNKQQPGDPLKGVNVMVDYLTKSGPWAGVEKLPWRLALGADCVEHVRETLKRLSADHEKWADAVSKTNCDDAPSSAS
ncbi:hypothetical protein GJ744_003312 [Endocarpon pusillum]|uniref:Uncharacterized protein n=1 Tax=Endocarpon pusillum TaxID=364733 RepID=A0A8H7DZX7_9EURO|nr:hypothetical protein GJ744_003312 [Endocarpon pusillum]